MNKNTLQVSDELPKDWTITTLGEALPISYGKSLTESKRDAKGKHPVYGSSGKVGQHSQALTTRATLLIGRKGSVGAVYYSPEPCWPIDTTYFAEEREDIDLRFFEYLLKGLNLRALDKSTAVPGLSRDDYNAVQVAVAPIQQQKLIVAEIEKQFSRLDEAVANLKRVKANLKRYKAAVLKAAVEGKLTEEWRKVHSRVEPASELLNRILTERKKKWEEAELAKMKAKGIKPKDDKWKRNYEEPTVPQSNKLPSLPVGWVFAGIEQLLQPQRDAMKTGPFGSLLKKHEHKTEGVPVLGIENILAMQFIPGSKIQITKQKAKALDGYTASPGDILISRSGTVGEVCVVPENIGEARISTNLLKLSLAEKGMLPDFFTFLFNGSPFVLNQVSELCKGSTRIFLNQDILKRLVFVLPSFQEQIMIVQEVNRRFSLIDGITKEIEHDVMRAERLRQSFLHTAFSGKLIDQ